MSSLEHQPFVLTIDVEPGHRHVDLAHSAEWEGFVYCHRWLEETRQRLEQRTGWPVTLNWFLRMDPQIERAYGKADWVAHRYGDLLHALADRGDLMGLHVHAYRWDDQTAEWVTDHGDPRWVEQCVAVAVRAFIATWGKPPQAFRFGDRWLSDRVIPQLIRLGVRQDLTVEPGTRAIPAMRPSEQTTGCLPDYRNALRHPYRPRLADYRVEGRWPFRRRLWMLPVSTGCINGPALPDRIEPQHDFVHLNLGLRPEWIRHLLDGLLETEPIVVSVARTGDAEQPGGRANLLENLEHLANHPAVACRTFTSPARAIANFRRWRKRERPEC
jgi:hypothetical protein